MKPQQHLNKSVNQINLSSVICQKQFQCLNNNTMFYYLNTEIASIFIYLLHIVEQRLI